MTRFTIALRRFAAARGKPDLYHETITVAFMLVIADRAAANAIDKWDAFSTSHADLLAQADRGAS